MWSFEGDYRRKPQQRLGGASKTRNIERSDLLNQLKADREEREVNNWSLFVLFFYFITVISDFNYEWYYYVLYHFQAWLFQLLKHLCILLYSQRQRRREAAAVTLQAWARGVLSQRRTKLDLRHQYDSYLALTKAQGISEGSAIRLIALLIRIFHPQKDSDRLVCSPNFTDFSLFVTYY